MCLFGAGRITRLNLTGRFEPGNNDAVRSLSNGHWVSVPLIVLGLALVGLVRGLGLLRCKTLQKAQQTLKKLDQRSCDACECAITCFIQMLTFVKYKPVVGLRCDEFTYNQVNLFCCLRIVEEK